MRIFKIFAIFISLLFISASTFAQTPEGEIINGVKVYWSPEATPEEREIITEILDRMVYVKGGEFMMGSNDPNAHRAEKPYHKTHVSDFMINRYEVTQKQWEVICGNNPSSIMGKNRPVVDVNFYHCWYFINRISDLSGLPFRMPYEPEWEYAAKGGPHQLNKKYSGSNDLDEVGWYDNNSDFATHAVGKKAPNSLGLFDMSGNVGEWIYTEWRDDYNSEFDDEFMVIRGGSWGDFSNFCTNTSRSRNRPNNRNSKTGFRLALTPQPLPE